MRQLIICTLLIFGFATTANAEIEIIYGPGGGSTTCITTGSITSCS